MLPNGTARHFVSRAAPSPRALRGSLRIMVGFDGGSLAAHRPTAVTLAARGSPPATYGGGLLALSAAFHLLALLVGSTRYSGLLKCSPFGRESRHSAFCPAASLAADSCYSLRRVKGLTNLSFSVIRSIRKIRIDIIGSRSSSAA